MKQRYTRKEFYELVWSKPLTHLAKDFSLSDVALHKIAASMTFPIHRWVGGRSTPPGTR